MSSRHKVLLLAVGALVATLVFPVGSAAGGGCHPVSTGELTVERITDPNDQNATIAECSFLPDVVYIEPGSELTWVNKDAAPHTVTGVHLTWGSEKLLEPGDKISVTFEEQGVFPYYCLLHPGMSAAVVVGDPDPSDAAVVGSSSGDGISGPEITEAEPVSAAQAAPSAERLSASTWTLIVASAAVLGGGLLLLRRRRSERLDGPRVA